MLAVKGQGGGYRGQREVEMMSSGQEGRVPGSYIQIPTLPTLGCVLPLNCLSPGVATRLGNNRW